MAPFAEALLVQPLQKTQHTMYKNYITYRFFFSFWFVPSGIDTWGLLSSASSVQRILLSHTSGHCILHYWFYPYSLPFGLPLFFLPGFSIFSILLPTNFSSPPLFMLKASQARFFSLCLQSSGCHSLLPSDWWSHTYAKNFTYYFVSHALYSKRQLKTDLALHVGSCSRNDTLR